MNPKNKFISSLTGNNILGKKAMNPALLGTGNLSIGNQTTTKAPTVNNSVVSNTAATTPPTKPTYTPFVPSINNSPKDQFVDSLSQPKNGLSTIPGPYDPATGKLKDTGTTGTPTPIQPPKQESPYLKYLNSMFDPEALKTAQGNITDLSKRTASELKRNREREDELRANKIGQSERGQSYQLGEEERLSNRSLADLAIAKGYNTEIYDQMINAGKTVYEAEQAQSKANTENKRYASEQDYKKEQDTYKQGQDKIDNDLAQAKFDEDKRQFGEENALATQKANAPKALTAAQEAKQIADSEKEVAAQQSASQSIGIINNLLSNDRYKAISGATQTGSIPFFGDRTAVNEYDQLQGLLKLGIRGLIKGQGAVSDYEGKVLGQAASSLSRLTGEGAMREGLLKVRGILKTNSGQITPVRVTNPETGESITTELSGPEIYQLVSEGNTITYK